MARIAFVVGAVETMVSSGKLVAAVCHGPQLLIEADLINAGARWVDQEVAVDGTLITSRKPADLPAFTRSICS